MRGPDETDETEAARLLTPVLAGTASGDGLELATRPDRLEGGRSAELFRFRLAAGPADLVDRELVLRLPPDRSASTEEGVIQAAVSRLGLGGPPPTVARPPPPPPPPR